MKTNFQTALILYEGDLQSYCEKSLRESGVQFFHIPDTFWRWIYKNCTVGIRCWLYKIFGGLPDMMIMLPIDDTYTLLVNCELKRPASGLRESQKDAARRLPWITCKTPDEIELALTGARAFVEQINHLRSDNVRYL